MKNTINKQMFDTRYTIARKVAIVGHARMKSLEVDDLTQELYLAIMVAEEKKGTIIEDEELIATICWNRLGRIIHNQYDKIDRRKGFSLDEDCKIEGIEYGDIICDASVDVEGKLCSNETIKVLLNKYKEGTRERDFLNFYLSKAGLRKDMSFNTIGSFDGYNKENLSKLLGFNGTSDKTFQKFKKRMSEEIAEICRG